MILASPVSIPGILGANQVAVRMAADSDAVLAIVERGSACARKAASVLAPMSTHKERGSHMSPLQRPISGPTLAFDLAAELHLVHEHLASSSRTARTLVKNGPLRATLIGLAAGGELAPHSADGPITVHVLEGAIEFEAEGTRWPLPAGSLFALDAGIVHAVRAPQGGVFLLTVALRPGA